MTAHPRSWSARLAIGMALAAAFFFVRFFLLTDSILMTPEECHTGGIASELLRHGVQFPLRAYTPETYENGIVVEGFLATGFFALFGANILALKLLAFTTSLAGVFLCLALLRRGLDAVALRSSGVRLAAFAFACVVLAAAPATFVYKAMDALGDHNEGSVLSLLLLWLLLRRIESPSRWRWGLLWLLVGACVAWEKGSASVGFLAGLYELHAAWKSRWLVGVRRLAGAIGLATVGYSPAFLVAYETRGGDWRMVVDKFLVTSPGELVERYGRFVERVWLFLDENPLQVAIFVLSLVWLISRLRRPRVTDAVTWLAAFSLLQLVMVSLAVTEGPKLWYLQYVFYMVPLGGGLLCARVVERLGATSGWKTALAPVLFAGMGVVLFARHPGWRPSLRAVVEMQRDQEHAACYSRFGRSFSLVSGTKLLAAAALCRRLEGAAALSCLTGLTIAPGEAPPQDWPLAERQALAFGAGRAWGSEREGAEYCHRTFTGDPGNERLCLAGRRWDCAQYGQLFSRLMMTDIVQGRPTCEMEPPWPGYERAAAERFPTWGSDPRADKPPHFFETPGLEGCEPVLRECFSPAQAEPSRVAGDVHEQDEDADP